MIFLVEHQVPLETGEDTVAVMVERNNNSPSNVSDFIQQGPGNGVVSLTVGVPISFGRKMSPKILAVGNWKRFRIS
jgi:hypothetical protein